MRHLCFHIRRHLRVRPSAGACVHVVLVLPMPPSRDGPRSAQVQAGTFPHFLQQQSEMRWVESSGSRSGFFSHFEQLNGFSPVWILSWVLCKLPDSLNFLSHFEQLNGFSLVWILS